MKINKYISNIYNFLFGIKFSDNSEIQKVDSTQIGNESIFTDNIYTLSETTIPSQKGLKYLSEKLKAYSNSQDVINLASANSYTDSQVTNTFKIIGDWNASTGLFPSVGSGEGGIVLAANTWFISVAGTIGTETFAIGDRLTAIIDNPLQITENWNKGEKNDDQATELTLGLAKISTQAIIENSATTNDTDITTPKKFWQGIAILKTLANTWDAAQTFLSAPKLDSLKSKTLLGTDSNGQIIESAYSLSLDLKQATFVGICAARPILSTDLDIDYTARTITIARVNGNNVSASHPIRFFVDGSGVTAKFEKYVPQVFSWTNTNGKWYFYFDVSGNPISTQTPWADFSRVVSIMRLTYNNTYPTNPLKGISQLVEYHQNTISAADHEWKHTYGAIWESGLDLICTPLISGGPSILGSNTCVFLTSGKCIDDNLDYTITNSIINLDFNQDLGDPTDPSVASTHAAILNIRYKNNNLVQGTRFPFLWNVSTNIPQYVNASGVITNVPSGDFFVYFIYAIQDNRYGNAIRLTPVYQTFSNITNSRAATWATVQSQDTDANDGEIRPLYKLIFEYRSSYSSAVKYTVLRETQDIRKQTVTQASTLGGSLPASSVTNIPSGNIVSTNIQNAVNELDTKKAGLVLNNVFTGFNQLGELSIPIKTKYITGTTESRQGYSVTFPHNLTFSKIFPSLAMVNTGTALIFPNAAGFGNNYACTIDATSVIISNILGDSSNILSKEFIIEIKYKE